MPTSYPGALDALSRFPDDVTDDSDSKAGTPRTGLVGFLAQWLRDAGAAIRAMQAEQGVNPSGSFVDVATRLNAITSVNKSADQTTTSTTGVAITDLAFPVVTGGDYMAEFWLMWSTSAAGVVPHFAATYPGVTHAITFSENLGVVAPTTGGTDSVWDQAQTASGTYHAGFVGGTNIPAANALSITRFTVILKGVTADGTLQMNVKSEAAATQTIYKASKGLLIFN